MTRFMKLSLLGAALSVPATSAFATPIVGSFSFNNVSGTYMTGNTTSGFTGNGTAQTATGLDFGDLGTGTGNGFGINGQATVSLAKGSFAGLNGTTASIADILLGASANPYTMNPFISFGSNSNIKVSFNNASYTRSPLGTSITIMGNATYDDGNPADASFGTFSMSTNSQTGSTSDINFTFTGNASAATPEPSSLALLGTGLLGVAGVVRKKLAKA